VFSAQSQDRLLGFSWQVTTTWDGAIGIFRLSGVEQSEMESVVQGPVRMAWSSAVEILGMLNPHDPRYLRLAVAGGRFSPNFGGLAAPNPPIVSRGPSGLDLTQRSLQASSASFYAPSVRWLTRAGRAEPASPSGEEGERP
jgi:hypothetical protein